LRNYVEELLPERDPIFLRGDEVAAAVEAALGSRARVRMMRLFSKYPGREFTKYRICRATGMDVETVGRNLRGLEAVGLVVRRGEAPVRYALNGASGLARAVGELFQRVRAELLCAPHISRPQVPQFAR